MTSKPASNAVLDRAPAEIAPAPVTDRALAWLLLVGGLIGTAAALVLAVEKFKLLTDPDYVPSCSINPVLSCGSIMTTDQAEILGFPNPLIGIAVLPMVAATGAAVLAGARLARWYWLGLQAGATAGMAFVCWLIFQSLYRIGALCPYCMVVWSVVLPIFCYLTLRNASLGVFVERVARARTVRMLGEAHALLVTAAALIVVALIGEQFWFYWSTLL